MVIAQPIARRKDLISMYRERYVLLNPSLERLKHHIYVTRQTLICTTPPIFPFYLSFTVHYFYT